MLHHLICFFLLLAWANADYLTDKMIRCNSSQHRRGSLNQFGNQPNDTELIQFNDLLGDFISTILDHVEIPHHLIFDCNLAKDRESIHNPRKSFGVSQVTKIEGDGIFNITGLADLFTGVAREVIVGIEKRLFCSAHANILTISVSPVSRTVQIFVARNVHNFFRKSAQQIPKADLESAPQDAFNGAFISKGNGHQLPKPRCFGMSECFGTRKKTYLFGCDYTVHNAVIMTKCAFERRKLRK